jgi:hypothetical protein
MTVVAIAVTWLLVGLGVAAILGATFRRAGSYDDQEEVPRYRAAAVSYVRHNKRDRCHVASSLPAQSPHKKPASKRRNVAA